MVVGIVNRNSELSRSLLSIAMAGVEAERPSRMRERLAHLAMRVSGTHIVDAMTAVSRRSHSSHHNLPEKDLAPREQIPTQPDHTDPMPASAALQTKASVH